MCVIMGFPGGGGGEQSACRCRRCKRHRFPSHGRKDPLKEEMVTHSSIPLAEKSHEQRSLADYSPWGRKELHRPEHIPQEDFCDPSQRLNKPSLCSKTGFLQTPRCFGAGLHHTKKILP